MGMVLRYIASEVIMFVQAGNSFIILDMVLNTYSHSNLIVLPLQSVVSTYEQAKSTL